MKTTIILRPEERKRLEKMKGETRLRYSAIIGNLILGRQVGMLARLRQCLFPQAA